MKQFIRNASAALLCMGLAPIAMAPVAAADEIELKAMASFPASHEFTKSFLRYVDLVNERGKGIVQIKFIGGPEVSAPAKQPVALQNGLTDFVYGPAGYYIGMFPEGDFTAGFKSPQEARENGGFALVDGAMREKLGATFVGRFDSGLGLYMALKEKPPMKDGLPDLSGMKIRSSPVYRDFITDLGGTSVVMSLNELYTALERGVVEGAGSDLESLKNWGTHEFLKYWIDPPFSTTGLLLIANAEKWDNLPDDARDMLQSVAIEYENLSRDAVLKRTKEAKEFLREKGMTAIELTGENAEKYVDTFMARPWGRMKSNKNINIDVELLRKLWL